MNNKKFLLSRFTKQSFFHLKSFIQSLHLISFHLFGRKRMVQNKLFLCIVLFVSSCIFILTISLFEGCGGAGGRFWAETFMDKPNTTSVEIKIFFIIFYFKMKFNQQIYID